MMNKKNKLPLLLVAILVTSLSLGLMAFTPIDIQDPGGHGGPGGQGGPDRDGKDNTHLAEALGITEETLDAAFEEARANSEGREEFQAALASALGISEEALQTARETARESALSQALADGDITQEEYDFFMARQAVQDYYDRDEILAGALGISVAELQAAQESGKRIPDLLEELGISQEDFQAAVDASQEAALAQAVSDGVITQEQADQLAEGGQGGPGGRGGKGKGKGPGGNQGDQGTPAEGNG